MSLLIPNSRYYVSATNTVPFTEIPVGGVENVVVDADDANAPVYNLLGVKVDASYKGIVVKNGKKYVQ